MFTKTNPVRERRNYTPKLDVDQFGLSERHGYYFQAGTECDRPQTLRDIIVHLKRVYCQSIGVEFMYIRDLKKSGLPIIFIKMTTNQILIQIKKSKFEKAKWAVAFESFLHTKYVGQKRFSIEGGEALIPALDILVEYGAKLSVKEFVIGMAHRGRLSVLANIFKKPFKQLFRFEGKDM